MASNCRILVIDDNRDIHEDFRKILGSSGGADEASPALDALTAEILGEDNIPKPCDIFELDFASQGQEGLELVQQSQAEGRPYAVAFVDVRMPPGWDGVETIERLWGVDDNLHAVIVTAYADYEWSDIIERLGHTDRLLILKKPFENIEIRQMASAVCEKWQLAQERKAMTVALKESEARYADLYDNSPDMYVSVMADTALIRQCNQTVADKLGYTKEEIVGRPIFELYHPDCMDGVEAAFQLFVETGEVHNAELQLMRKDGSKVDVTLNVTSVRDEQGKVLYSRSAWIDTSEKKRAERELESIRQYLQSLIDSMPSALIGINTNMQITHLNSNASILCGLSMEEARDLPLAEHFPMLEGQMEPLRDAAQKNHMYRREKFEYSLNGEKRIADLVAYPMGEEEEGEMVIRIDDITERVRMEELLTQSEKMLSVGGLAAGMAHEINNPLGGILQGLQNIRRRFTPELKGNRELADTLSIDLENVQRYMEQRQIYHFMDEMADAGQRASDIVSNMLQFSRKADATKSEIDLNSLIDKTLDLAAIDYDLKKKYDFRQIEIVRDYASDLPLVPCIASEIQQVLLNILRNAAQALQVCQPEDGPRIIVRTHHSDSRVLIEIEDNGPGMEEEVRARAFEPFYTTRAIGDGTGLGLSVSYFIINEEHDGTLSAESEPGKGSLFIIELPVK
jgi:PAS domain S-box-containing protein